jgi:hypothetical protein
VPSLLVSALQVGDQRPLLPYVPAIQLPLWPQAANLTSTRPEGVRSYGAIARRQQQVRISRSAGGARSAGLSTRSFSQGSLEVFAHVGVRREGRVYNHLILNAIIRVLYSWKAKC